MGVSSEQLGRLRPPLVAAAFCAATTGALAGESESQKSAQPAPQRLEPVEIEGRSQEEKSAQEAGRRTVAREDLLKYGDASIIDSLARIPGISIGRDRRREIEVRLRGLGAGYTLLLVDGERLPVGFSIESLSPDLIERIEISTVGRVETAQGIAGTINIVLRKRAPRTTRELRVTLYGNDRPSATVGYTSADKIDAMNYTVPFSLKVERSTQSSSITNERRDGAGTERRATEQHATQRVLELSTAPRASWTLQGNDKLVLDALVLASAQQRATTDNPVVITEGFLGPVAGTSAADIDRYLLRTNGSLVLFPTDEGDKLDIKLGATVARRVSDASWESRDKNSNPVVQRSSTYPSLDSSASLVSKYSGPYREDHQFAAGLELSYAKRREQSIDFDRLTNERIQLNETPKAGRAALYLQDEFSLSRNLRVYTGLRGEIVDISTASASSQSRLWSPVIQLSYKSLARGEAISSSLSRAHKMPPMSELSSRRYYSTLNSPGAPDAEGNPFLRPESAWILETSYEKSFGEHSSIGMIFSKRKIQDIMLTSTSLTNGRWVAKLDNRGAAQTSTIDLNLRGRLPFDTTKDGLDVTSNFSWSRSRLSSLAGPDNRIEQQVPFAASVRLEYKSPKGGTSVETSLNYQARSQARVSQSQLNSTESRKSLDLSITVQASPAMKLRGSISNILQNGAQSASEFQSSELVISDRTRSVGARTVRLAIERKL